jgi:flagellar L-ring protein precursor FlgH
MKTASKSASEVPASGSGGRPDRHFPLVIALAALALAPTSFASSLWNSTADRSMFADRKAATKGDILTVVVAESAAATNSQSKKTARESALEDAVTRFLFSPAASHFGTHNGELPALGLRGKANSSGGGDVSSTQSLNSRAAVLVTDVMPNGNLVIQGVRVVTFSGETQYVVLHGLVRPDDISPANTIFSSNIADARVEFVAEGALSDAQKRGWLSRLYEKLRPF